MKRPFRIFELSKNEQHVVLIVMFVLLALAFIEYERRVHRVHIRAPAVPEPITSPTPFQTKHEQ